MCSVNSDGGNNYGNQNITLYRQVCISFTFKCQILGLDQPQMLRLMPDTKQQKMNADFFPMHLPSSDALQHAFLNTTNGNLQTLSTFLL